MENNMSSDLSATCLPVELCTVATYALLVSAVAEAESPCYFLVANDESTGSSNVLYFWNLIEVTPIITNNFEIGKFSLNTASLAGVLMN